MQHGRELPQGRRECVRALAQLVYDNGERLGSHFEVILPPLLDLVAPSAVDLDARYTGEGGLPYHEVCFASLKTVIVIFDRVLVYRRRRVFGAKCFALWK